MPPAPPPDTGSGESMCRQEGGRATPHDAKGRRGDGIRSWYLISVTSDCGVVSRVCGDCDPNHGRMGGGRSVNPSGCGGGDVLPSSPAGSQPP